MTKSETNTIRKESPQRSSEMFDAGENKGQERGVRFAKFQDVLHVGRCKTAEEVKAGGLINDLVRRDESPKSISKGMTNGEFGEIAGEFFGNGVIIVGDEEFGKQGARRSKSAS